MAGAMVIATNTTSTAQEPDGQQQAMEVAIEPAGCDSCGQTWDPPDTSAGSAIGYWFILNDDWPANAPSGAIMFAPRWTVDANAIGLHMGPNIGLGDPNEASYLLETFVINPHFQFPYGAVRGSLGFGFTLLGVDSLRTPGPVFSLLNPRVTAGLKVVTDSAWFGVEGQYGYMIRLGDIPNISFAAALMSVAIRL